jgi:hypothetical protein
MTDESHDESIEDPVLRDVLKASRGKSENALRFAKLAKGNPPSPGAYVKDGADLTHYISSDYDGGYAISDPEGLARLIKDVERSMWHQVDRIYAHARNREKATELVLNDPRLSRDLVSSLFTQRWMEKTLERMRDGEDVMGSLLKFSSVFGQGNEST